MLLLIAHSNTKSFNDASISPKLHVYSIHDKGEIPLYSTGEEHWNYSVSIDVSPESLWREFPDQVKDLIQFLRQYREELVELLASADDIDAYLEISLMSRISDEVIGQNDNLTKDLIQLAGGLGLGIEMSIYGEACLFDP